MIGFAEYRCSCVRYVSDDNTILIIGITVGVALLLLIVAAIITAVLCRKRRRKKAGRGDNMELDSGYSRQLPDDPGSEYSRELPQYPEPSYSRRMPRSDDYDKQLPED